MNKQTNLKRRPALWLAFLLLQSFGPFLMAQTSTISVPALNVVNIGGFEQNSTQQVIGSFQLVQTGTTTLSVISAPITGTYQSADIATNGFKLYSNTVNNLGTATLRSSRPSASTGTGETISFGALALSLPAGTYFFWITIDVSSGATSGRTIAMGSMSGTNFGVSPGSASGTFAAQGTCRIIAQNAAYTPGNLMGLIANIAGQNSSILSVVEVNKTTAGQTPNTRNVGASTGITSARLGGSATSNGYLSNSNDLTLMSFPTVVSSDASVNSNTITTRTVFTYNNVSAGSSLNAATTYTGTNGQQPRSASTLNNSTWFIGEQNGFFTNNASSASPTGNVRGVKAFGGNVYAFTASTTAPPVGIISLPTGGTYTALPGLPNGSTTLTDFYMVRSGSNGVAYDMLYTITATTAIAGVISKYSLVSGSWVANGTAATAFGGFGLVAERNGSVTDLYLTSGNGATAANSIIKVTDANGYNAVISVGSSTTLYTSPTGTTIKGIAFSPMRGPVTVNGNANNNTTLSGFSYFTTPGGPSAEQSFTVAGTNLTNDIVLTAPSDFEISTTSGSGFTNNLTLIQSAGSVSSTTIYVRLKASLSQGNYNNQLLSCTSSGSLIQMIALSGNVSLPIPTINNPIPSSLTGFSTNAGTFSSNQSFTVQGNGFLTGTLDIAVTSGQYEIATSAGGSFGSSISIPSGSANSSNTIFVRIPAAATGQISNAGVLTFSSTGASNVTMNLSGIVINATTSVSSLTGFTANQGTASTEQTFTLTGQAFSTATGNLTITAPTGFEVSLDNTTYATTRTQPFTGSSLAATTIYVRIAATAAAGAVSGNVSITGGGLTTRNVAVSGLVSGLAITGTLNKFFSHAGYASEVQSFSVAGSGLGVFQSVTIGPLSGYKFGTTAGNVNSNSVSVFTDFGGDLVATNVFVRLDAANTAGNYNGNITATQGSISSSVAVTGTTFAAPQAFSPGNFVVARVGDGSVALSSVPTETFLDEYSFTAPSTFTLVQSVPLTLATNSLASGNKPFTLSGSATSDGYLNLSPDRKYLTMVGYATAPRSLATSVSVSQASTVNRVVGNITYDGNIATSTLINDAFSTNNVRSAVTLDSTGYWVSGAGTFGGLRYVAAGSSGASTLVANVGSNNGRVANISNSVLYVSSQSGSNIGINRILDVNSNTGLFTNSGNLALVVSGLSSTTVPNPYNFVFLDRDAGIAGNDLLYVADNSSGLLKFSFDGFTWTARGSYPGFLQGITASVNASGQVEIYATGAASTATLATTLYRLVDATAYNANLAGSGTAIGSVSGVVTLPAGTNKGFKGISFTPIQNPKPTVAHLFSNTSNSSMPQGSSLNPLAMVQVDVTLGNALLTGVSCNMGGSYATTDITAFKLYASDDNVLDGTDALLATVSNVPASGAILNFSSLAYNIAPGSPDPTVANTKYLFVSADVSGCGVINNNVMVNFFTGIGGFTYASADKIGTSSFAAQTKSISVGTPSNVTNLAATSGIPTIPVSWTLPACYDGVIVVAHTGPITGTPAGTNYTFNTNYSLATNNFPGGGRVVYQGTGNNTSITGLSLLTTYQIKVFVRISSGWSTGASGNATTDEFTFYSQASGDLNTGAIWAYSPNGTPQTATALGGFLSSRNIRIQPGHTVTVSSSAVSCNDIKVDAGAKLFRNSGNVGNMVYFNMAGDLIVNGEIGNGSTFDAIGINCEGSTGALANNITGSGIINMGRIRKSATTNPVTEVNINADVNVRFFGGAGSAAIYNNADNTKLNLNIAAGKTLTQTDATGVVAFDGVDGTATGLRSGSFVVNGNLVVNGKLFAVHNNNNASYIPSIVINNGGTFTVNDMDYSNATGNNSFTFTNNGSMTLKGNLNIVAGSMAAGSSFTLQSTAAATGMITGTGNLTGAVTVQRYVPNASSYDVYHYLSNPTANNLTVSQNLGDDFYIVGSPANYVYSPDPNVAQPSQFPNTWWFNDANANYSFNGSNPALTGWTNAISTAMSAGKGYACKIPTNTFAMDYTGTVNNSSITTPIIKADDGFNLIGNPYPSPLSWNSFYAVNSSLIQNNLILWNPIENNYAQYSNNIWINNFGAGTNDKIALGQGFFVVANASGNASFTNAMRSSTQAYTFFEAPTKSVRLQLSNGTSSDETVVQEIADATDGYTQEDAGKYTAGMESRCLISSMNENSALAINRLRNINKNTEIPLQVISPVSGTIQITATGMEGLEGLNPMIYDAVANSYHVLVKGQPVSMQASAGNNGSRFSLVFARKNTALPVAGASFASAIQMSSNGILFNQSAGQVRLSDASGKQVISRSLVAASEGISFENLTTGIYLLQYEVAGVVYTQKIPVVR